jgi:hypothetical protein
VNENFVPFRNTSGRNCAPNGKKCFCVLLF